jgi:crossover junction endodeoxyribonuclease RuvC
MRILGIDPGTATTGWAILETVENDFIVHKFDLIETDKDEVPGKRLQFIVQQMNIILEKYKPDVMAIEKIFFASNAKTVIRVGQAQGVMIYTASLHNVDVAEIAPGHIKKVVTGNGRADKKMVQAGLRKIFGAKIRSKAKKKTQFDNAADALAIAYTHAVNIKEGGEQVV